MNEIKPVATWETHCKRNPSCAEQAYMYESEAKSIEIDELRAAYEALQKENERLTKCLISAKVTGCLRRRTRRCCSRYRNIEENT